ncbi:hypothetical protein [Kaarinaea lacus]
MNSKIIFFMLACLMVFSSQVLGADRLELDNTAIIGSRELPKVLYIVPWKKSRIGTLAGVSEKGAFKESMTALDRDVFLRELQYYSVLNESDAVSK